MDAKRLATVCVIAIATCLLIGTATASAAPTAVQAYAYSHTFASEGQIAPSRERSNAVAVDPETGDVIVADELFRLAVFAPDAGPSDPPITTFGGGLELNWGTLAVAPNGDLYASYDDPFSGTGGITRFKRNPGSPPTYTVDASYAPPVSDFVNLALALDPGTGDLLVAEGGAGNILRFDPAGNLVSSFRTRVGFSNPSSLAATSDGTIFVVDIVPLNFDRVLFRFSASGEFLSQRTLSSPPPNVFDQLPAQLAYDPLHDSVDLLNVATPGALATVEGLTSDGKGTFVVPFPASTAGAGYSGLALDPTRGRLFSVTFGPTGVQVFEPATYPGVEVPAVSGITPTGAHVSSEVDPGSPLPTGSFARFEYSLNEGTVDWQPTPDQIQTDPSTIEVDLTGLLPNRAYLIRAAAGNDRITHFSQPAPIRTARVVPVTVTDPATGVTETGAVLNGSINPVGLQTTYHFEYGTTTAYGSRAPVGIDAIAGGTYDTRAFGRSLTGLQPDTTYHYRLVATNAAGVGAGEDRTFTTLAAGSVLARPYEQVTPAGKSGASIVGNLGFQPSSEGSRLTYLESSPSRSLSSPLFGVSVADRGSTDWGSTSVDPPMNVVHSTVFFTTLGVSADLGHALVVTSRALAPGAIENNCNLYVVDLATKSYELVATTDAPFAMSSFNSPAQTNKFLGGSADFGTVVFNAVVPMFSGAPQSGFYRWTRSGGLEIASRLPGGAIPTTPPVGQQTEGVVRQASDDGRRVYFAIPGGPEAGVYLREDRETRSISVSHRAGDDEEAPQAGEFLGASRDGRYAFFSANTVPLTEDAPSLENNVYRYDADTGELEYTGGQISGAPFIQLNDLGVSDDGSTIYFGPNKVWRNGRLGTIPGPTGAHQGNAFVSPGGRYLAFWEPVSFGIPSEPANEAVQLYDAVKETTTCVSCRADGSNPGGARLPNGTHVIGFHPTSPFDDQGNLFFTTKAGLVAADGNGSSDVYEYSDGKLNLISPGTQPFDAVYAAVSPDSRDVYFTTAQALVGRDVDEEVDVYDARVGGGLAAQNPPARQECLRDDCKATPNGAGEPRIGGSELLQGPGNVKPQRSKKKGHVCPKGKRAVKHKGKSRCVKRHPKKANHNRRQGR